MRYHNLGLLRVDKIATPIKVVEIHNNMITKGYFEKKSTVDFIGIIQGVFVAFDAKETELKSFPLKNIHSHQVEFMADVVQQGGLAFLIVHFKLFDEYYLVPYDILKKFYNEQQGKKSIPYTEMTHCIPIEFSEDGTLRYLDALNKLVE